MEQLSGNKTVPQIFINNKAIGGFDDLSLLEKTGKLDQLIK
jgi:glutaredoxin 3